MPGKKSLTEQSRHVEKILYKKNKSKTVSLDSDVGDNKPDMKSKGNKNSKTVASATVDLDAEGATEYLNSKEIDGETVLDVECGPNKALMYLSKLCQGSKGPCVLFKGSWLTPNEFQYVSGRETAKDWKRSIRHQGKSIKLLFSKGIIVINNNTQRKEKKKSGGKRRLRRLSTLVSLETSRDEITESQDSGSSEPARDVNKSPNVDVIERIQNDQDTEMSDDEGVEIQSDSTENYELESMDTTPEDPTCASIDTVKKGDDNLQKDFSECEEESTSPITEGTDIREIETILTTPSEEAQVVASDYTVTPNDTPVDNDLIAMPKSVEKCSDEHEENCVVPIIFTESVSESKTSTIDSQTPEDQQSDSSTKSDELLTSDKYNHTGDKKRDSKRSSPTRESKLGNIIDQLRVSKEKINKEPLGDAVSLASGPDQELPPSEKVIENCSNCIESKESDESVQRQHEIKSFASSSNEKFQECPTSPVLPGLASNISCSRISDDISKPDRHSKLKDTAKYVDLQRTTIKQEVKENHEKTIRNENDMFCNSSKPKDALLKAKHKLSMDDCPSKCVSTEKVRNMAPTPDKLCAAEKDYNSYMKLLAAKQEHSPFLIPPPLHDPYLSLWNPEIPFSNGLFNPYMCFGQSGLSSGLGKQSSSSVPPAFFPFPPSSLPFLTPPRSPYTMPYPILDSAVPHSSPKESPTLPHSGHPPSKKRGSAETDNACALDLSTKRIKVDSNKNNILSHSVNRSEEIEKYRNGVMDLKYRSKKSSDEKNHQKQSHSDILRHTKYLKAWAEAGGKEVPTKCACGADNPDNIMNWSVDKVFSFVSKLEGCSSYAKTFRDNRIEGKTLPLLTTDTLIRNLGLKVGPAIILTEAVTRHVQDMSRFFHPCSYCKLKSSQRLSV